MEPGFIGLLLDAMKEEASKYDYKLFASMCFDEMKLRPQLDELSDRVKIGFVDYGQGIVEGADLSNCELATDLFMVMVNGINCKLCAPVLFMFVTGMDGKMKSTIIRETICVMADHSVFVRNVSCDGFPANLTAARQLSIDVDGLKSGRHGQEQCSFPDPAHNGVGTPARVTFTLDPCHMLKLHRNNLGDTSTAPLFLPRNHGNLPIRFDFFEKINYLQSLKKLRLKNAITPKVIQYRKNIMSVPLAVKLMSRSSARTLQYYNVQDPDLPGVGKGFFRDVGPTVEYVLRHDETFDLLNSRSCSGPW